jgi:hypothetical protein
MVSMADPVRSAALSEEVLLACAGFETHMARLNLVRKAAEIEGEHYEEETVRKGGQRNRELLLHGTACFI